MTTLNAPTAGDLETDLAILPRVTCIMPTRDRRALVAQSIRYFQRQDYPDTELIVVDDGYDAIADLIPENSRILYERLMSAHSIGAKRNLACRRATGEIIAHWDDDDWCAPNRLRRQVTAMLSAGADACGLSEVLHYRPLRGDAWLYRGVSDSGPRVAGCSIVYRRAVWAEAGFPDTNLGEDSAFVGRLPPHRLVALPDRSLMVAVVHNWNVSALPLGTPQWEARPLDDVAEVLGPDRPFYTQLRGGRVAPPSCPTSTNEITLAAAFDVFSGYGTTAEYLALSLARSGAQVRAIPLGLSTAGLTEELLAMTQPSEAARRDRPIIYHSWIRRDIEPFRDGRDLFVSTMWEANRLPASWVPIVQEARAVIVPSTFVADACRASGVSRPIVVVPQGIDPDVYHWEPRDHDGLVSLIVAPVDDRKHTRLAVAAWKAAFAEDPTARLVIKTTYGYHNYVPDDPRITYVDRVETTRGIADWYRRADVLLALGNEGFGLPLVEGMATGLPVIALNAEGQSDICRDARDLVLPVPAAGLEPHADHTVGPGGHRSVPDFDAIVRHLLWVADHRAEADSMGRAASEWAIDNRNIWQMGPHVLDVIRHTTSMRVGRAASRTFWVTSAGTACGIADYTARLQRNVPFVRLTASMPELSRSGVVHIQHEPALMDNRVLERFTAQAREVGIAVAITQHSVFEQALPWERNARALVAATSDGSALLRERHPELDVAHIPLGCETWRFPTKARRGRTIGVFGFPGKHKGLGRLTEAVRHVRGCEVLLLAHDPACPKPMPGWPTNVPLRCESEWTPLAEVAARLAAEADVIVFHYDEVTHRSASSASMLGLSTGVPVLTSATNWFADLGRAVHRAGTDADSLADGLVQLLEDDELRDLTTSAAREYCVANSWSRIAARHVDLWNSLEKL